MILVDMPMPKNCYECRALYDSYGLDNYCALMSDDSEPISLDYGECRHPECPIKVAVNIDKETLHDLMNPKPITHSFEIIKE